MLVAVLGKKLTKSCIITGGAGFIGGAISSSLASSFDRLVVIDNFHPQIHDRRKQKQACDPRIELVVGDVASADTWDSVLESISPDLVLHLAAETGTSQSLKESTRHGMVNVVGTTQMLDAFLRHSVIPKRIVLTSSRAVYGEGEWIDVNGLRSYPGQRSKSMLDEKVWDFPNLRCLPFEADTTQTRPTSIYGSTKLAQEHILESWAKSFGVELAILRLQNVYGPGQSLINSYTGIVPFFMSTARNKQSIPVYEDGNIVRDFVYIDDVAEAIVSIALNGPDSDVAYDIGSGHPISLYTLASKIANFYGAPPPHVTGQYRHGDIRHASCNMQKTISRLNWSPSWGVEKGIDALNQWIVTQ